MHEKYNSFSFLYSFMWADCSSGIENLNYMNQLIADEK